MAVRLDDAFQDLGDGERLDDIVDLDQNAAIGTHGKRGADGFLRLRRSDRYDDHFLYRAGFLQTQRFLDRDFVERVHRHLDIGEFDAGAVAFDPDLHIVIDYPLDRYEDFHRSLSFCQPNRRCHPCRYPAQVTNRAKPVLP